MVKLGLEVNRFIRLRHLLHELLELSLLAFHLNILIKEAREALESVGFVIRVGACCGSLSRITFLFG